MRNVRIVYTIITFTGELGQRGGSWNKVNTIIADFTAFHCSASLCCARKSVLHMQ